MEPFPTQGQLPERPKLYKGFVSMFDLSQQAANEIFGLANFALILGAALVFVGTITAIWTGGIRERYGDERIARNERETATANAQAESARATAALANESAAEANERAGLAEQRAAEANLALEKYKAPRSITKAQQDELREKLQAFSGISVDILCFGETTEINNLRNMLINPLAEAGWSPRTWTITGGGAIIGTLVVTNSGAGAAVERAAVSLVLALRAIGIESEKIPKPAAWVKWGDIPGMGTGPIWEPEKTAAIRLLIGAKQ
jgi:hypothetical protein